MPNFTRTQLSGTWTGGSYTLLPADMSSLDAKQFAMVNGDLGGMWAPSNTLDIGNAGLALTGPLQLGRAGSLATNLASGARIKLNAGEWPLLEAGHAGRIRRIAQHVAPARTMQLGDVQFGTAGQLRTMALSIRKGDDIVTQPEFVTPLRVHNGAMLNKVSFYFRVPVARTTAPLQAPRFRVVRLDKNTGLTYPLKTTTDGTGYDSPTNVQDAASWYVGGAVQTFDYVPDAGTVIDTLNSAYFAQTIEERTAADKTIRPDGKLLREIKADVLAASVATSALSGAVAVDGQTIPNGGAVLLKDQTNKRENGIWLVNTGGPWTRAGYCDDTADMTRGFLVRVVIAGAAASVNGGTVWQYSTPFPMTFSGTGFNAVGSSDIVFEPATGQGNIYYGSVAEFAVADMQWQ